MTTAGLLLTGGASRRMGRAKGGLPALAGTETLAERTGRLLAMVAQPALEVGPGYSHLDAVPDARPHSGPLAALADGAAALNAIGGVLDVIGGNGAIGGHGDVLVLATDLPHLGVGILRWLAGHPFDGAVVPLDVEGRGQPLCARYPWRDLALAGPLVASGHASLSALLEAIDVHYAPVDEWVGAAGAADALDDVDTPEDLARARRRPAAAGTGSERTTGRDGTTGPDPATGRPAPGRPAPGRPAPAGARTPG